MLNLLQTEAVRIAIARRKEEASPNENISVAVGRLLVGGQVLVLITRTPKTDG
jgi:hypothetical protein